MLLRAGRHLAIGAEQSGIGQLLVDLLQSERAQVDRERLLAREADGSRPLHQRDAANGCRQIVEPSLRVGGEQIEGGAAHTGARLKLV